MNQRFMIIIRRSPKFYERYGTAIHYTGNAGSRMPSPNIIV